MCRCMDHPLMILPRASDMAKKKPVDGKIRPYVYSAESCRLPNQHSN